MTICETIKPTPASEPPPGALLKAGVGISLRPRQRLQFGHDSEHIYIVRSGVLMLETLPHSNARQIIDLYYAGDVVRPGMAPAISGASLLAATQAEVLRVGLGRLDAVMSADHESQDWIDCALARQYPRRLTHLVTIGSLNGDERVATLLIEMALRVGEPGFEDARTFDLPLSRTDMADYLSLNADTLSRIMSRLRQAGVLGFAGRGRAYAPSFSALCKLSPLADAIVALAQPPKA